MFDRAEIRLPSSSCRFLKVRLELIQDSAMKLVHAERNGEAFDSQLVIGVRESYVNLSSNTSDKLQVIVTFYYFFV